MNARTSAVRGSSFRAIVAIACMAATVATAQDPRAAVPQRAARDWLALVDKLDFAASFAAAGDKFRAPITQEEWADALAKARSPLGAVVQRTIAETTFDRASTPDGGPELDIVVILFRTAFANRTGGSESVTLALDPDGAWRVIGYFIR
jgi:hypothetical protein